MGALRKKIKTAHRQFDGWAGQLLFKESPIWKTSNQDLVNITLHNFHLWGYSKKEHFLNFNIMPIYRNQTTKTCDLKVYQDLFVYTFIINNLASGSRILEVGGGDSRIISSLSDKYEFWNLDKLEGAGHGPKSKIKPTDHILVRDYIGAFTDELPDNYFDLVFSISAVEHFPVDENSVSNILIDLNRLLNKNAYCLHCVDALMFDDHIFVHPLVIKAQREIENAKTEISYEKIKNDSSFWTLPIFSYYTRWFPITKKTLGKFGHPFSINILWKNI